jgi:prephenate dehydrogenase
MDEPGFAEANILATAQVAVVGLGLMGGSLALALHQHCAALLGIDPDPASLRLAADSGVFERLSARPAELLCQADVVVLAAPVSAILNLLEELPALIPDPQKTIVLDFGSTKVQVSRAMQALPARFDPLPAHPMCGKERAGFGAAEAGLFKNRPFAFTRLERTSGRACRLAEELAEVLDARPLWLDPETHDRWAAAISHLPYLVASALAGMTPLEAAPLASSGFSSTTRVAATSPAVMLDTLLTNQANILAGLQVYRRQLDALEAALQQPDPAALEQLLRTAAGQRAAILSNSLSGGLS